jgi:hypothetical protein
MEERRRSIIPDQHRETVERGKSNTNRKRMTLSKIILNMMLIQTCDGLATAATTREY